MHKLFLLPTAQKDLDKLSKKLFNQVKGKMLSLGDNPRPQGCIKLTQDEGYRLRAGDYRILYRIDDLNKVIYIYKLKHRREAYR